MATGVSRTSITPCRRQTSECLIKESGDHASLINVAARVVAAMLSLSAGTANAAPHSRMVDLGGNVSLPHGGGWRCVGSAYAGAHSGLAAHHFDLVASDRNLRQRETRARDRSASECAD
jgi:hypothetical protein